MSGAQGNRDVDLSYMLLEESDHFSENDVEFLFKVSCESIQVLREAHLWFGDSQPLYDDFTRRRLCFRGHRTIYVEKNQ
jgi:hypothetical protein